MVEPTTFTPCRLEQPTMPALSEFSASGAESPQLLVELSACGAEKSDNCWWRKTPG